MKQRTVAGVRGTYRTTEHGWQIGAETPCFLCREPVGPVAVGEAGFAVDARTGAAITGAVGILLHPRCAVRLAYHFGMDAEGEARPAASGDGVR